MSWNEKSRRDGDGMWNKLTWLWIRHRLLYVRAVVSRGKPHVEPNTSCLRVLGSVGAGCVSVWMQKKPFISHPGVQLCRKESIRPCRLTSRLSQTMQFLHVSLDTSPLIYAKLKYMFFQKDRSRDIRKWENQHFPWWFVLLVNHWHFFPVPHFSFQSVWFLILNISSCYRYQE